METNCLANTEYGKVRGSLQTSSLDIPYIRFLGIPYATPPLDRLRFKAPQRPLPWGENVIDALDEAPQCINRNFITNKFVGSEDCLYLNIFTKDLNPKQPYAVMLYIHGGAHSDGSCDLFSYSPDYILQSDVILVTFNYRLGPLGFLSLKDKSLGVPGNAGMKDQQMAMKFVKDNIHNFGGNPDNVTLFGHSTGGTCVSLHCIADSSRGLFHRAIIMSGSAVCNEGLVSNKNFAFRLAKKLGYDGSNIEHKILSFLEQADIVAMAEQQHTLIEDDEKQFKTFAFGPCTESYETDSSFMLKPPINLLKTSWSNDIDIIMGGSADEGLFHLFLDKKLDYKEDLNLEDVLPLEIRIVADNQKLKKFAKQLKEFYFTNVSKEIGNLQLKGDEFRWLHIQRLIHARLIYGGKGNTFLYRFAIDSPTQNHHRIRWFGAGSRGVVHADELSYIWKNGLGDVPNRDSIEFITIMRFTSVLTSFAITGDPNSNVLNTDLNLVIWKPVASPPYMGLNFDTKLEFKTLAESERVKVWETFYEAASVPLY